MNSASKVLPASSWPLFNPLDFYISLKLLQSWSMATWTSAFTPKVRVCSKSTNARAEQSLRYITPFRPLTGSTVRLGKFEKQTISSNLCTMVRCMCKFKLKVVLLLGEERTRPRKLVMVMMSISPARLDTAFLMVNWKLKFISSKEVKIRLSM